MTLPGQIAEVALILAVRVCGGLGVGRTWHRAGRGLVRMVIFEQDPAGLGQPLNQPEPAAERVWTKTTLDRGWRPPKLGVNQK
jgi:hypothetical protein